VRSVPLVLHLASCVALGACGAGTISRQSTRPIPDLPPSAASDIRGTPEAASRIGDEDQVMIIREVIRRFFRPLRGQVRWIDPQPLAHRRSRSADSAMALEETWVLDIVTATGLSNVCPLTEGNLRCQGMPGGVIRFSEPYAAATDSAFVFATYTPVERGEAPKAGGSGVELEFHLARRNGAWTIASKRTIIAPAGAR
jgi:hypothetical protein